MSFGHSAKSKSAWQSLNLFPNVFTPNGDSYNSHFKINDLVESKWNIQIYNRWGDAVYKKDDYAMTGRGGGLPEGVLLL
ncbi:MAG: gliding motility-associated C-terminal domain-containing protein [Bacteroidota bacterium]